MLNTLKILFLIFTMMSTYSAHSQEQLEIEGAIIIKNSEDPTPAPGTIRFNPEINDFEGWNGQRWISLTRLSEPGEVAFDIDGNVYRTIHIGTQHWIAENLKVTKLNDNVPMFEIINDVVWIGLTTGAWCYYENDESNNIPYGKLYNWYAVNTGKLCPSGWHVPSHAEWLMLFDNLGGSQIAGGKMKEAGLAHWDSPNAGANNESGFAGLPGGQRSNLSGSFLLKGKNSYWWSSTGYSISNAWAVNLGHFHDGASISEHINKISGYSVRCVKD